MDKFVDQRTLVVVIVLFCVAISIGLFIPAILIKDAPVCGQEKDENGEMEQVCRDQHHYINLYTKLFVRDGDKPQGTVMTDHHLTN
jgi:hypothetical protein